MVSDHIYKPSVFNRLRALERDQERAYYELGPVWGTPPRLHEARHAPGKATYAALEMLLAHIEARGLHAKPLRTILAGCQADSEKAITPSAVLFGLPPDLLDNVLKVFAWIASTGGLGLDDFADRGERFLRLVLRKQPQTIAALIAKADA